MMKIMDYIFYRMHLAYEKHEGDGKFTATIYITLIESLLIAPFFMIAANYFRNYDLPIDKFLIFSPLGIIFIFNLIRYFKKGKLENLKSKFKNSKYNRWIKNWMLYLLLFVVGAWGFMGIVPIVNFLQLISSLIKD